MGPIRKALLANRQKEQSELHLRDVVVPAKGHLADNHHCHAISEKLLLQVAMNDMIMRRTLTERTLAVKRIRIEGSSYGSVQPLHAITVVGGRYVNLHERKPHQSFVLIFCFPCLFHLDLFYFTTNSIRFAAQEVQKTQKTMTALLKILGAITVLDSIRNAYLHQCQHL